MPKFVAERWQAVYVPARTPAPVVRRLHDEIVRILKEPEIAARLEGLGVNAVGSTPARLAEVQKADAERWARVIKAAGIKAD